MSGGFLNVDFVYKTREGSLISEEYVEVDTGVVEE